MQDLRTRLRAATADDHRRTEDGFGALYLRNVFRIIADVHQRAVPVLPELDEEGRPLDQSLSILRSVSPIHIEYLKNMRVEASLSISIVVDGRLWGLFACHHYQPRLPGFAQRSAAELYGQMFSLMLESREHREAAEYESRARAATDRMMVALGQDGALLADGQWLADGIMEIIPADGAGVVLNGGAPAFAGLVPNPEQFGRIIRTLVAGRSGEVTATDHIAGLVEGAAEHAHLAAGLLAIPLSRQPRDYIVLFRAERLRNVRWAGNPEKPVEYGPHGSRLTPRKSFEQWSELVKGRALPFSEAELRVARAVRTVVGPLRGVSTAVTGECSKISTPRSAATRASSWASRAGWTSAQSSGLLSAPR